MDNAGQTIINPSTVTFPVFIRSAGQDRTFGTADDINENNHPELCRITEDDVRAVLRGYTYCEDGTPIQRDNIYVYWPTLSLNGTVTITQGGPYSSSSTGTCPYDQVPPPTCYYFETPERIPAGIRKVLIGDLISPYIDQFVVINGGGTLHDGSTGRMRWNLRGGSCGGCIEAILPRIDSRDAWGECSGGQRDVFSIRIRNRCAVPVNINSIRVDYPSNLYYLNAFITPTLRSIGAGWSYDCGGATPPGGRSGLTYSFNTNSGVVLRLGTNIYLFPQSCSPSASVTIPAGGTRYLTVGRFITSTGGCGDIRLLTFTIYLSDGSVLTVPPP